jgi:hypothetical protein
MIPQAKGPPNGGTKTRCFSGALSYGAKIHPDAFFKINLNLCWLLFLGAFSRAQEASFKIHHRFCGFYVDPAIRRERSAKFIGCFRHTTDGQGWKVRVQKL